jgi:hypothetical protein
MMGRNASGAPGAPQRRHPFGYPTVCEKLMNCITPCRIAMKYETAVAGESRVCDCR